jgi:amino acid transporter
MTAIMIGVSIPEPPKTRGLAVILPVGMIIIATLMVVSGIMHWRGMKIPYRLSSHVAGSVCPPLTFCILEDIVACDGRGGKAFRKAAMERYHMSPLYRKMLVQLNWAWALSAYVIAAATFAIVMTIPPDIAYGLGWGIPCLWAIIGAIITTKFVQRSVGIERELWDSGKRPTA